MTLILSLFDHSGGWSQPYRDAGYDVIQVDIKLQPPIDIMTWDYKSVGPVHGILAAPPCTDFSLSGSRFFARKDADGTTAASVALVHRTLEIIDYHQPVWWALENPMSRIHTLVPRLGKVKYNFHPWHHGDPYLKTTWLWGNFNIPERDPVEPTEGRRIWKVGGPSEATKEFRSVTPPGFAKAFFEANP